MPAGTQDAQGPQQGGLPPQWGQDLGAPPSHAGGVPARQKDRAKPVVHEKASPPAKFNFGQWPGAESAP